MPHNATAPIRSHGPSTRIAAAGLAALGVATAAHAQSTIEWASPVDGDFAVASNWSPAAVPGQLDRAVLGDVGPYVVRVAAPTEVAEVVLTNPQAELLIQNEWTLFVFDAVSGPGVIVVGDGVTTDTIAELRLSGAVADSVVRLNGADSASAELDGGRTISLGDNGVVTGQGRIVRDLTGGTIRGSGGDRLEIRNIQLGQTRIDATEGEIDIGGVTIHDSTIQGVLQIAPSNGIVFGPNVTIEDAIVVGDGVSGLPAGLALQPGAVLEGRVQLNGSGDAAAMLDSSDFGGTVELGGGAIVIGQGTVEGPVVNRGLIQTSPDSRIRITFEVDGGTLRGSSGGLFILNGTSLTGVLIDANEGEFRTDADTIISDSIIRGEFQVRPGNLLTLGPNVAIQGEVVVNNGTSLTDADLLIQSDTAFDGVVRLNRGRVGDARILNPSSDPLVLGRRAVLIGQGSILGPVESAGTLAPGDRQGGIGELAHSGGIALEPTSQIEIDLAGAADDQYDRIDGTGSVTLNGSLRVDFVDTYLPEPHDQFEIITATDVDGSFRETTIAPVGAIGPAHIVYTGESVIVVVCAADRDADGELTIFDFLGFQNQFDAGDPQADLDGDGNLTLFDFLAFQNRFDAGCS